MFKKTWDPLLFDSSKKQLLPLPFQYWLLTHHQKVYGSRSDSHKFTQSAAFYLQKHHLLRRDVHIFHFLMVYDYKCSLVEKSESERKSCLIDLFCCLQNIPCGYVRSQKRSGFSKKGDEQFSTSYLSFVSSWLNNRWRMHLTLFSCKWWLLFRCLHAARLGRKHLLVIGN